MNDSILISAKLGRNVESEKLLKREKKEGDVGGRNREIVMLLLWIVRNFESKVVL